MDGLSSTFTFTTRALAAYFSAIASTVGASMRQGAHQAAQKSTSTGLSDCKTSFSKLLSLTSVTCSLISVLLLLHCAGDSDESDCVVSVLLCASFVFSVSLW